MSENDVHLELPNNIEHYLAALSKVYANQGKTELQKIVVNSQIRVHEKWSSDNWNGGIYGHALYLVLPETIYIASVKNKIEIQNEIKIDINKLHNVQNEFIEEVFLEMESNADKDWRAESGVQISTKRVISSSITDRIWDKERYRVFLSHKSEVKKETALLKEKLKVFGVSSFVAHEDIIPTKEWQNEIENALLTMEAFVVLLTENYHDSDWTDQEVGYALARGVPVISVKLGKDPYGFIGKFQALSCIWEKAALEIVKIFVNNERMLDSYIQAVRNCESYEQGNSLAEILPSVSRLSDKQVEDLINTFDNNSQVRTCFGFSGAKPHLYKGLAHHLNRLTGHNYVAWKGKIELAE
jgi:hypothetical protein